jgi:hypothetical protein
MLEDSSRWFDDTVLEAVIVEQTGNFTRVCYMGSIWRLGDCACHERESYDGNAELNKLLQ